MGDMSAIIVPKSDQINADDLLGRTLTITVTDVKIRGGQEQPISIHFEGSDKVFRPCKSMCRVMAQAWGLDSKQYIGKSMTLYCDPTVKFGPLAVGGIRISHMSHIDGPMVMALTATKGVKKSYKVQPLVAEPAKSAPVDKAAEGVRTLIARIGSVDAGNLQNVIGDPVVAKQRAWLATNRPELAAEVDAAIAAKSPTEDDPFSEGPADEQRGEQHSGTATDEATAADLIGKIGQEKTSDALDAFMSRERDRIDALPEEIGQTVRDAYYARFEKLSGQA